MEGLFLIQKSKFKQKLIILYILNITDLFFTQYLLSTGFFSEANGIMQPIVDKPIAWLVKGVLLLLILIYWYKRSAYSNDIQFKRSMKVLSIGIIFYILINISHIIYTIYYFAVI